LLFRSRRTDPGRILQARGESDHPTDDGRHSPLCVCRPHRRIPDTGSLAPLDQIPAGALHPDSSLPLLWERVAPKGNAAFSSAAPPLLLSRYPARIGRDFPLFTKRNGFLLPDRNELLPVPVGRRGNPTRGFP